MPVYASYNEALPRNSFVLLSGLARRLKLPAQIVAKLDFWGPSGFIYDRVAAEMLDMAMEAGELERGDTVIEASSGPFATSLCIAAARRGLKVTLCVPESLSARSQKMFTALGAILQYVPGGDGRTGMLRRANALVQEGCGYFLNYLDNDNNPEVHRRTTGPEIMEALHDSFDYFVAGVNSAGTITGTSEYLKAWSNIKTIAVEPYENQVLTGGFAGKHGIVGMGLPFIPPNYNPYIVDGVMTASTGDANAMADTVFYTDGVPVSIAGGAALAACVELAKQPQNEGKTIVTVFGAKRNF